MKTLLICIDNFYPAYRGGGPIQSVTNLIHSLGSDFKVHVITSAYDLGCNDMLPGITPDSWNRIDLPPVATPVLVWYAGKSKPGYRVFRRLVKELKPDIVYLNGIFSLQLFMIPLVALRNIHPKPAVVICPRGMLQKGALADKTMKKKMYLRLLKLSGVVRGVVWHATGREEKEDIRQHFPANRGVVVAGNIPRPPMERVVPAGKTPGTLRLVYLSLITEKKNLLFLLHVLKATENITLDIYGPVKDNAYWGQCVKLMDEMKVKVTYQGDVLPENVQQTFSRYHASVLLTKGENFGHAIYESLSAGRPVITSNFTPWNNLTQHKAGWNVDISEVDECVAQLNEIRSLGQPAFSEYVDGAYQLAKSYFAGSGDLDNYKRLFSDQLPADDEDT